MKKNAFLFDSSSSYTKDIPEKDIYVVPVNIQYKVNGILKSFAENVNITQDEINKILLEKRDISTSLVNPEVIREKVIELLKEYEQVFYVPISYSISSTYDKSLPLMNEINSKYGKDKLLIIKSNAVSYLAQMVMDRFVQLYDGNNFEEAQNIILDDIKNKKYCAILFVNQLDQLIKGGRIKKVKGTIAKIMNFKLLVTMTDKLEFFDKSITYNNQISKAIAFFNNVSSSNNKPIKECGIVFDGLEETQNRYTNQFHLLDNLKQNLNLADNPKFIEGFLPGVIKCHTGLNSMAIVIKLDI